MYSAFSIATLYFLYKDKYPTAFVCLGLAFACKLQTVFVLPFILAYYVKTKKFSIFNFLISVAILWTSGAVAFIYGRSLLAPLMIYLRQTVEYPMLYLNFPSFWALAGNDYLSLRWMALGITLTLCALGTFAYLHDKRDEKNTFWPMATWFAWTLVLFLPSMHERYAYLLDILLVILACMDRRFIVYALISICISLWTYGNFMFDQTRERALAVIAVIYLSAYTHYSLSLFKKKE